MDKKVIVDYVTKTPENINKRVLDDLLNEFGEDIAMELPPVETTDDGKVLKVVGGKWVAEKPLEFNYEDGNLIIGGKV